MQTLQAYAAAGPDQYIRCLAVSGSTLVGGTPSVILHVRIWYVYCTYNWHILSVLFRCIRAIIRSYTYNIRPIYGIDRIVYVHDVYYTYISVYDVFACICTYRYQRAVYCSIVLAYTYNIRSIYCIDRILYGHDVYYTYTAVYARICMYIHVYSQYFGSNTCIYIRSRCGHGCFAFTCAGAGLYTFAARSLRQVCRAASQAQAGHPIQSDQVFATEQRRRQLVQAQLHAEVPLQSW